MEQRNWFNESKWIFNQVKIPFLPAWVSLVAPLVVSAELGRFPEVGGMYL